MICLPCEEIRVVTSILLLHGISSTKRVVNPNRLWPNRIEYCCITMPELVSRHESRKIRPSLFSGYQKKHYWLLCSSRTSKTLVALLLLLPKCNMPSVSAIPATETLFSTAPLVQSWLGNSIERQVESSSFLVQGTSPFLWD